MKKTITMVVLFVLLSTYVMATNYYVSTAGNDTNDGKTTATAFATIQKASDLTVAGDVVQVMNGIYDVFTIQRAGTPDNYITFTNYAGHKPKIKFASWNAIFIIDGAAYIKINGFEVEGNNANVTLSDAKNQPGSCEGPNTTGTPDPKFNGNGISIDGRSAIKHPHHIIISNNIVHDCGGGGISSIEADYVTIENNISYNNSWYTIYGTSGISLFHPWNFDSNPGYRNIIRNNRSFGNILFVKWAAVCAIYDGNGIILDDFLNTQSSSTIKGQIYTGRTLVANNIVANNGGSGIHTYIGTKIDILNNTAYKNSRSESTQGEIFASSSSDVNIYNNIIYAEANQPANTWPDPTVSQNYNLFFNTNLISGKGANDILADPKFVAPSTDPFTSNFQLQSTSPAINAGSNVAGQYATTDFIGTVRPQGLIPDIGAYEVTGSIPDPDPVPDPEAGTGLSATYYDNMDFTGMQLTRVDPTVDFNWGTGSPASTIGAETFSARWSGQVKANYTQAYTFYTNSDDGVRLWVNGTQLINNWTNHGPTENNGIISLTAGQKYTIVMEYYENGGGAVAQLSWSSASQVKQIIPQARLYPATITPPDPEVGTGLSATYYDNMDFTGTQLTRVDPSVNFNWGNNSPGSPIGPDTFSARWSGQVKANYSEAYTFYTNSDDGVRLWVNGVQLVNNWTNHAPVENSGTISLVAGQKYTIVMEFFENGIGAVAQLSWSSASQVKQIIPQSRLYPASPATLRQATYELEAEQNSDVVLAYPNPTKDVLNVTFMSKVEGIASIGLMTTTSQGINRKFYKTVKGINTVTLSVKGMNAGLYLLHIKTSSLNAVKKILITD